jgi:hypothetical protein
VIADGAGSAPLAERGSFLVTDAIVRAVSSALTAGRVDLEVVLLEAATAAREAVTAEATQTNRAPSEFASTLLAVVATDVAGAALQVGDGVIVVAEEGEPWNWVFWPQRGEFANTTRFITDTDALTALEVKSFPRSVADIALMSDGLEPLAIHYASKTAHQPFFESLLRPLLHAHVEEEAQNVSADLQKFLGSTPVLSRTDDDLSLILATRRFSAL